MSIFSDMCLIVFMLINDYIPTKQSSQILERLPHGIFQMLNYCYKSKIIKHLHNVIQCCFVLSSFIGFALKTFTIDLKNFATAAKLNISAIYHVYFFCNIKPHIYIYIYMHIYRSKYSMCITCWEFPVCAFSSFKFAALISFTIYNIMNGTLSQMVYYYWTDDRMPSRSFTF